MIVAEQKAFEEIYRMVSACRRVLLAGCGTCVTVCFAGGEKEVGVLASMIRMQAKRDGKPLEIVEATVKRQCDTEFIEELTAKAEGCDAILSLACGAGIQFVAERHPRTPVLPGVNTLFIGVTLEQGDWAERCAACGDCVLHLTGGVCPVARCAKRIHNGPCGGSKNGKCEVAGERDCGWALILQRLEALGRLASYDEIVPPRDWRTHRDGGQRRVRRDDLRSPKADASPGKG